MTELVQLHCQDTVSLLDTETIKRYHQTIHPDWQLSEDNRHLSRTFTFDNYYQTVAFINAVVQVAHSQNHHPGICFGYRQCEISYSTHSVDGLSLNDFICSAKIDLIDSL